MTDPMQKDRIQQRESYRQFLIALAIGTMISAVGMFFFEYFGFFDLIRGWP